MKSPILREYALMTALAVFATNAVFAQAVQQPGGQKQRAAPAQADDDTITIDSALVNTYVSVRDKSGRPVPGLTKDDFTVLDDGKEQPIVYFSQESNQPLRLAVVLDRSRSVEKVMAVAQAAARDFFSSLLASGR